MSPKRIIFRAENVPIYYREHLVPLQRQQNKAIEKDQLTQRFVELKSMISDPDSVYTWSDLCRDFNSQFFDLDRRSISLGTHDIKMYGVDFEKRGFTEIDAKLV